MYAAWAGLCFNCRSRSEGNQDMITIESTPEFVASVYERMDRTLSAVRQRLGRPMGLAEKVLLAHLDDPIGLPKRWQIGRAHV